ncbi:hypothetical protein PR202_gb12559 [Eleusine coracana subsp. coracana]|uniref:DUF569 domain-containing protein n=1 Tax=Eleusine coracana subsp. coracana TaxID=191504 RepID=A0AAV5EN42_ELECO|nr:hypothetical protein PR202_gb12559 [Eleusine coracana subsp. coracana]
MELFERARTVRLRSHHDKYLYADEDESRVTQDRNASSPNARWLVEPVPHAPGVLRLRSRYGRYLSASNEPFLHVGGASTGRRVLQTLPHRLDSSVEWVPDRAEVVDGGGVDRHRAVRLRTRYGNFLRANAGLPPWRNSVTHDAPNRHPGWVVWDVEVVQVLPPPGPNDNAASPSSPSADASSPAPPASYKPPSRSSSPSPAPVPTSALRPPPKPQHHAVPFRAQPPPPPPGYIAPPAPGFARLESTDSFSVPLHKVDGRMIHYHIGDNNGNVGEDEVPRPLTFNGTSLEELLERLQEETGLDDIIMCSRSPITGSSSRSACSCRPTTPP